MSNQKSGDQESSSWWSFLWELIAALAVIVVFISLIGAWPISFYFFLVLLLLLVTRGKNKLLLRVVYEATLPIAIGIGIVFVILIFIKLNGINDDDELRNAEEKLINFGLHIKKLLDFSFLKYLLLMSTIILLNLFIPRIKAVSRFIRLTTLSNRFLIIVATVSSFTFFTSMTVDDMLRKEWEQSVTDYNILLREEQDAVAKYMMVRTLNQPVKDIGEEEKIRFVKLFRGIIDFKPESFKSFDKTDGTIGRRKQENLTHYISKMIAINHAHTIGQNMIGDFEELNKMVDIVESDQPQRISDHPPNSRAEIEEVNEKLQEKRSEVEQLQGKTNETVDALKDVFANTISLGIPEIKNVAGVYIETLINVYAEHIFEKNVEPKLGLGKRIQEIEAKVARFSWKKAIISLSWIASQELEQAKFHKTIDEMISKKIDEIRRVEIEQRKERLRELEARRRRSSRR